MIYGIGTLTSDCHDQLIVLNHHHMNLVKSSPFNFKTFFPKQSQTGICYGIVVENTFVFLNLFKRGVKASGRAIRPVGGHGLYHIGHGKDAASIRISSPFRFLGQIYSILKKITPLFKCKIFLFETVLQPNLQPFIQGSDPFLD
jgi:hypothetical protein